MTVNPPRIAKLQEHGLTEYEARAYLALLELETSEASPVADLARVPRTKIYQALDGLEGKKLLTVIPERPKRYSVSPIAGYMDELEGNLRGKADIIAGQKEALSEEFAPRGKVQVERAGGFICLKGRANIGSKLTELIGKADKDFAVATSAMGAHRIAYHHDLLENATARGTAVRILAPLTDDNEEATRTLAQTTNLRHALVDLGRVTLAFVDDKEVLLVHHVPDDRHYFQGSDVALWSDDPAIVSSLKALFTLGWGLSVDHTERATAGENSVDPALASVAQRLAAEVKLMVPA